MSTMDTDFGKDAQEHTVLIGITMTRILCARHRLSPSSPVSLPVLANGAQPEEAGRSGQF